MSSLNSFVQFMLKKWSCFSFVILADNKETKTLPLGLKGA